MNELSIKKMYNSVAKGWLCASACSISSSHRITKNKTEKEAQKVVTPAQAYTVPFVVKVSDLIL